MAEWKRIPAGTILLHHYCSVLSYNGELYEDPLGEDCPAGSVVGLVPLAPCPRQITCVKEVEGS